MHFRSVLVLTVLLASISPGLACEGQVGGTIFSDTFADDSGGWEAQDGVTIKPPNMELALTPDWVTNSTLNTTFNAAEGDYCTEIAFPSTPPDPKNGDYVGLIVLAADYDNFYEFQVGSDSSVSLWRKVASKWEQVFNLPHVSAVKVGPDAVNALRIVLKDQKMTLFVNGQQVKVQRVQEPKGANRFGIYVQIDKKRPKPTVFQAKSFTVTDGG